MHAIVYRLQQFSLKTIVYRLKFTDYNKLLVYNSLGNKDFGARDISTDSVTFRVTDNYMINTFSQSGQNFQQF